MGPYRKRISGEFRGELCSVLIHQASYYFFLFVIYILIKRVHCKNIFRFFVHANIEGSSFLQMNLFLKVNTV